MLIGRKALEGDFLVDSSRSFLTRPKQKLRFESLSEDLSETGNALLKGEADILGIRPEHLRLAGKSKPLLTATPDLIENLGEVALVHCKTARGMEFIAKTTDLSAFPIGKEIKLTADKSVLSFFNSTSQQAV